ncbi:MAG TPA: CBS domain-containing protein [Steroidobacteraceae bacterium]|nr:CBS domain-containing protein [Steroidobacteraceae bacterium]
MNVGEICERDTVTIRPQEDLLAAAQLMRGKHVGFLIVVEPAVAEGAWHPVGVLTDRDVVITVVAREANPRSLRVEDVMTRKPAQIQADESLDAALREMRRVGVRRLPVVGERGALYGVISLDDVLARLSDQLQHVAGSIRSEQRVERALRP